VPGKHPNTTRWGGPGASHEDRTKPIEEKQDRRPVGSPTNPPASRVSGGGGERDEKHSHIDEMRSSKTNPGPSPTSGREYNANRPRRSP
jgi:hypothetical protein